jgi:hypothetical protein
MVMKYTKEMQKVNRKRWVEALRSGEYEQGQSFLNKNNKFCCLGVLCEIVGVEKEYIPTNYLFSYGEEKSISACSKEVMDVVGLNDTLGMYNNYSASLANLNDGLGKSFDQIADIIESEPDGLFAN